jgi:tRNA threonylcarbamoyl adenosine modification protein YeaZ
MQALIIETSTERGLIALSEDNQVKAVKELPFGYQQSKFLMSELEQLLKDQTAHSFDCIGVGVGPGSYTGIRIGASVAKALAYAWKLPLIGFSSLEAFIPKEQGLFAAVFDAKISGVYFLKGLKERQQISYLSEPSISPLAELNLHWQEIEFLVTPYEKNIKSKIHQLYPQASWKWEEVSPNAEQLASRIAEKYRLQEWSLDGRLELLYLRKTEAELEKEKLR